jgi:serine/threonine protein kinase
VGKTIGEGNFAKVKFARSLATGDLVAVKVLSKRLVERDKLGPLIRREIKARL